MDIINKIDLLLNETTAYEEEDVERIRKTMERGIDAPVVKINVSKLGPLSTIMIKLSLDPREEWRGDIFENSRYAHISFEQDASRSNLEMFTKSYKIEGKKMRKSKAKNVDEAIRKINQWINKVK